MPSRFTDNAIDPYAARLRRLRRALQAQGLRAAYFASPIARRYFTGFRGTAGAVFVTPATATLFTDFRYVERAQDEISSSVDVVEVTKGTAEFVKPALKAERVRQLGIEDHELTLVMHAGLKKRFSFCKLVGVGDLVEELRGIKDETELALLRQAIKATDLTFTELMRWLKQRKRAKRLPTEIEMAWKVRDIIHVRQYGELAFDTIIASGANAARPHHEPTTKRLKKGEMVIIDMGVKVDGYHADMTRTVFLGQPTAQQRDMYLTTLKAQTASIQYLKKGGRSAGEADRVARRLIDAKYPGSFGHSLGHGVGLEIHEHPTLAATSPHHLKPNMVFSVEPGIYLPGQGGIRIEDLVLLQKNGLEVLSCSPKQLHQIIL